MKLRLFACSLLISVLMAQTGAPVARKAASRPDVALFTTYEDYIEALVTWRISLLQEQPNKAPRFKILQFEYTVVANSGLIKNAGVFRIDTQTGETWKYLDVITEDRREISRWIKIDEK